MQREPSIKVILNVVKWTWSLSFLPPNPIAYHQISLRVATYYQSARKSVKYSTVRQRWHFLSIIVQRVSIIVHYVAVGITSHVINSPSALKLTRCVSKFFTYNTAHYVTYDKYTSLSNRNYKCLLVRYISNMCIWVCPPAATFACIGCPETIHVMLSSVLYSS